jgi:hypothetical protein
MLAKSPDRGTCGSIPRGTGSCRGPRDHLPHARDHVEGIEVVELLQPVIGQLAEFQHHQPPAGFQHAERLRQGVGDARDVPDAEADRVDVEAVVLERQRHRVAHDPVELFGQLRGLRPPFAFDQHRFRHVEHRGRRPRRALEEPERDVARAARHVQKALTVPRREPVHHRVLPQPVDAAAHHVVHHVVAAGDIGEDAVDQPGLLGLVHRLEPEMRGPPSVVSVLSVIRACAPAWSALVIGFVRGAATRRYTPARPKESAPCPNFQKSRQSVAASPRCWRAR